MKFDDIVKVRKKYANYIFELCFKFFESPKTFLEEELKLKKNMDYDWLLQTQSTKINSQMNFLNQRIREFSKLAQFDKKAMNELMELKVILKGQKKAIEDLQLKHYNEIVADYTQILVSLSLKILIEFKKDPTFSKMQTIIQKTEKPFIEYCLKWKDDKKKYHDDISNQTKLIMQTCIQLLEDLEISIMTETSDEYYFDDSVVHKSSMKNITVANNCTNLAHYVENFKNLYPETLNFKENFLIKLELKNEFKDFFNIHSVGTVKTPIKMKDKFEQAKTHINKAQEIFYELHNVNRDHLIKLDLEKRKMNKVAINEDCLTQTTLKQWLEYDPDGIFYLFSEYLKEHSFS